MRHICERYAIIYFLCEFFLADMSIWNILPCSVRESFRYLLSLSKHNYTS